ncbi:hypothetical protein Plhal304r1_c010g0039031 [Plasmopara halstedii]
MKHLKAAHGLFSSKTETTEENKRRKVEAVNAAKATALVKDDPKHFHEMLWTRLVITKLLPLGFCEDDKFQHFA